MLLTPIFFVPFFGLVVGVAMGGGGKMAIYGIDGGFIEEPASRSPGPFGDLPADRRRRAGRGRRSPPD